MAKTTAVKNNALAKYDARLAELAKRAKKAESKVGGEANFISLRGGHMQYQSAVIQGDKLRAVIICSLNENQFYEGRYDPDTPSAPTCYAFAAPEAVDSIAPNPEHEMKARQSDTCAACPNFEWGSADVGRGKACKEVRRLALMTEKDLEDVPNAAIAFMKVSVTNLKYWAGYVRNLDDVYHKPSLAFITEISIVTDKPGTQPGWHLEFNVIDPVEDDKMGPLLDLYDRVEKTISFPYPKFEANAQPARNGGRGGRTPAPGKPGGGKKAKY